MARRRSARHTRPTGRRALEAAHAQLDDEVSSLRIQRYADHLELVRLTALVEGLVSHVQRLAIELAEMRRDLQIARTAPQQRDPAVAQLAAQVADLRATVGVQQSTLSELSGRLLDVMSRLGPDPWSTHPDATEVTDATSKTPVAEIAEVAAETAAVAELPAPPPAAPGIAAPDPVGASEVAPTPAVAAPEAARDLATPAPVVAPDAVPATVSAPEVAAAAAHVEVPAPAAASAVPVDPPLTHDLREPALPTVPDYPPPSDERVVTLTGIPASVSAAAAEMSRREPILAEVAASTPGFRPFASPTSDLEALDDETVLRLRMIRESFGR